MNKEIETILIDDELIVCGCPDLQEYDEEICESIEILSQL